MKKGSKAALLTALACVVCGLGLIAAAIAVAGGRLGAFQTALGYEERTYTAETSGISCVSVSDKNRTVRFIRSEDADIHVTCYENEREFYDIDMAEDGTLEIRFQDERRWYEKLLSLQLQEYPVTVALPEEYTGAVRADLSNGMLTMEDLRLENDVTLKSGNGRIEVRNCRAQALNAETSNGAVRLAHVEAEKINAKTSNGRVTAEAVRSATSLTLTTSNGAIVLDAVFAGESIALKSSNGSITGTVADAQEAFQITSETSNGSNNLPETWGNGDKRLHVTTSNGAIDIGFLELDD